MKLVMALAYQGIQYSCSFDEEKEITVSQQYGSDVCVPDIVEPIHIKWDKNQEEVVITRCGDNFHTTLNTPLTIANSEIEVCFSVAYPSLFAFYVEGECTLRIGHDHTAANNSHCDILIDLPLPCGNLFRIVQRNSEFYVYDEGGAGGLFVNGKKVSALKLHEADVLSVFTLRILFAKKRFYIRNAESDSICVQNKALRYHKVATNKPINDADIFSPRVPRLVNDIVSEVITLEKPPQPGGTPQINWLNILVMPMISVTLMAVLVITMGMSPIMLIMSGVMSVVSMIIAIINYNKQTKFHKSYSSAIEQKYTAYLSKIKEKLKHAGRRQLTNLLYANPSPAECMQLVLNRSTQLWERVTEDNDFMHVRLGLGTISAAVTAEYRRSQLILEENQLENDAIVVAHDSQTLADAPIICDLRTEKQVGIIGERDASLELIRSMVVELCTMHAYDELKIVAIVPQKELSQWSWLRWLPHCADDQRRSCYLFTNENEADTVLTVIDESLNQRKPITGKDTPNSEKLPHYLVIAAKTNEIERHSIRNNLFDDKDLGCTTLLVYDKLMALPNCCKTIIDVKVGTSVLYSRYNTFPKQTFSLDNCPQELADQFARTLAPMFTQTADVAAALPKAISFMDGYGVSTPEELNIQKRWETGKTYKSLAVPVAVLPGGHPFYFDIHEKAHGVDGIVAGMPGSGKTEMVQSWLLSLAVNFSPSDVSFVLIDFKGTGMIAPFQKSPHLAGSISNLDTPADINRNLISLRSEITRRETILASYNARNIEDVNDLNKSYEKGLVSEKLPILMIVIDEYAEFKKQYPEFGKEVDTLTSKGRALGMFVILMTQKPSGVVSANTEDNIKFRWCLRVANYSASREMLGRPDAAKINNPGRAYIKVGEDQIFEQVQSYWSGAPYVQKKEQLTENLRPICISMPNGCSIPCEYIEQPEIIQDNRTQINVIVQHVAEYCVTNSIAPAKKVWTDKLPEQVSLGQILTDAFDGNSWPKRNAHGSPIGIIDNPSIQQQYPLMLNLREDGHLAIYGAPVTGKTTLLQTIALSMAMTRQPDEVNIYIMDFGGWNMGLLADLPHVGGVANDNEPERIKKLVMLLEDTLEDRKRRFFHAGAGNIQTYREITRERIADIVLIVDNFGPVLKLYPDLDMFFSALTASGASFGIYMITTAGSVNAITLRISQNIKNTIALQMIEKSDYTSLVGKITDQLPQIMGRGYTKAKEPLAFQAALPVPLENFSQTRMIMRRIADSMTSSWNGALPQVIPELPEKIVYGSVQTDNICLGLSTEKVNPVSYDQSKQHYLLISGTEQSGKSGLLQVISKQLKEKLNSKLFVFDINNCGLRSLIPIADAFMETAQKIDAFLEALRPELKSRHQHKQITPGAEFAPIVLVIDDYDRFFSAVSNETIARLHAIVKIGGGLGVYLIVAGDAYGVSNLVNKGEVVVHTMTHSKQFVILGGCMNDHSPVQIKVPYSQKNEILKEKEGYFVTGDGFVRFKVMEP